MSWGAIIGAAGSILGGALGASSAEKGQREANLMNIQLQREQQAWEEKMSNTAMQRRMEDLRAAGVNPLLGMQSGMSASTPTIAPARVESATRQSAPIMAQAMASAAQVAAVAAQARKTNAEASVIEQYGAPEAAQRIELSRAEQNRVDATVTEIGARISQIRATRDNLEQDLILKEIEQKIRNLSVAQLKAMLPAIEAQAKAAEAEAKNTGVVAQSEWGQIAAFIRSLFNTGVFQMINSAAGARNLYKQYD